MNLNVDLILKIAGIGFVIAIAEQLLSKAGKDEYSILLTFMGFVIVLSVIIPEVASLFDLLRSTFGV